MGNATGLQDYFKYVNKGGNCRDYDPVKAGGWDFCGGAGCASCPAPVFDKPGRTDVEGCCWWGRGVIQSTGVCNFGKLNYFMGARGDREGRDVLYPDIDFCKNPEAICEPDSPKALKWIAGFFYCLNSVQSYVDKDGWNYMENLKKWTDAGMDLTDESYINACSGIVNRGCYNPPCGGNAMDSGEQRAANFAIVINAIKFAQTPLPPWTLYLPSRPLKPPHALVALSKHAWPFALPHPWVTSRSACPCALPAAPRRLHNLYPALSQIEMPS